MIMDMDLFKLFKEHLQQIQHSLLFLGIWNGILTMWLFAKTFFWYIERKNNGSKTED